ncbi:phosphatidate cytidylyltransferase [Paenalcaligenes niemegkensis]|uniref:phosphatidate cytidylyltransferase n=1 Tax=Paenalcaligenes niemegkensis TaxID=2895469 RepID=UPI001EE7D969|nr:phosphatidate cytidylyltransferase [Paenalcaligenes niemegkensis]MCQ9616288.1 phosphatidate cytidylyltransferase [Paenalcaligenes niemegkensis]
MLGQRIITAVVLIAVLVLAMFLPSLWPMTVLLALAAACALWEWLRLTWSGSSGFMAPLIGLLLFVGMLYLAYGWQPSLDMQVWAKEARAHVFLVFLPLVVLYWAIGVSLMLGFAQTQKQASKVALSIFGVFAVFIAWASLNEMLMYRGGIYLLSMMAIVWVADIAAYFAGKAWGKKKLAPRISPGKTWAGFFGGMLGVIAYVFLTGRIEGSYAHDLAMRWPWFGVVAIAAGLAALSVMGDLFESLLKRRAGVKDSSNLLPGHGGVFDRIDALLPVAPVALVLGGPFLEMLSVAAN